jgi:hypothetical protein
LLDSLYAVGPPAGGLPALYAGMAARADRSGGVLMPRHDNERRRAA